MDFCLNNDRWASTGLLTRPWNRRSSAIDASRWREKAVVRVWYHLLCIYMPAIDRSLCDCRYRDGGQEEGRTCRFRWECSRLAGLLRCHRTGARTIRGDDTRWRPEEGTAFLLERRNCLLERRNTCTRNDGVYTENDGFSTKNDGICRLRRRRLWRSRRLKRKWRIRSGGRS